MSLIGIDVGTSAIKSAAYAVDGTLLASSRKELNPQHPQPGWWEQDPGEVWQAVLNTLREVAAADPVRRNPPLAMAISASGRENFPVDATGNALGPCLIGADIRGAEYEAVPPGASLPEAWTLACGHPRERMDPIFRLLWWRAVHPDVMERAHYYLGWHDFVALKLTGRAVVDHSCASRYLVYDLATGEWSPERLAEYQIDADLLPEIAPWGALIGPILPAVADELSLPHGIPLAVGCHDSQCAAVGVGGGQRGVATLASGSFENMIIPTDRPPSAEMLRRGLSVMPQPGPVALSVTSVSPTGNAVLNWARDLLHVSLDGMEARLNGSGSKPSPVIAVPYLSGSMMYWENGRRAKGSLLGLTLATTDLDIVKAFMEAVAYEHINTLTLLEAEAIPVERIRMAGGGARSAWWTQLKSDMLKVPIEVVDQPEPGTLGAAVLAGEAAGVYDDLMEASQLLAKVSRRHEPDPARAALYAERLSSYRDIVPLLIQNV